jgi:tRNA 2-thiouridine synthesizing protein A
MMRIGMGFDLRIGLAIRLGRDRRPYDKDRFGLLRPSSMAETTFDLRGLKCPLPVLRTRKALAGMRPGDILLVACTDPLAGIDIPNLLRETGDILEDTRNEARVMTFRIRKS